MERETHQGKPAAEQHQLRIVILTVSVRGIKHLLDGMAISKYKATQRKLQGSIRALNNSSRCDTTQVAVILEDSHWGRGYN